MHPRIAVYLCTFLIALFAACGGGRTSKPAYASAQTGGHEPAAEAIEGDYGGAADGAADGAYGPSHEPAPDTAPAERPGLGTTFGERVESHVRERSFARATASPFAQAALYYNDEEGVLAQARYHGAELRAITASSPGGGIHISVADTYRRPLEGFTAGGKTYVVGRDGDRYVLVLTNSTGGTYEVVASVDGLDVVDGKAAGHHKRGYIIAPHSTLVIDGFRTSTVDVAAFRFGRVAESYAARTGDDRNVGVIGFAFFAEQGSAWTTDELHRRDTADPFPSRYSQPPTY